MSNRILTFHLPYQEDLEAHLKKEIPDFVDYRIISQSLDARGSNRGRIPVYEYRVAVIKTGERFAENREEFKNLGAFSKPPIIIGTGPAGLFAALRFAEYNIPCLLFERGDRANRRMLAISKFWRHGEFDVDTNVCYGEGGAGLFSDGKLITRIKSPFVQYVMNRLVDFGAPAETAYVSNPHLGSNKIRALINKISDFLVSKGCEILYHTKVTELLYENKKVVGVKTHDGNTYLSDHVILATGHSAHEMYQHLEKNQVAMAQKDFAVGVRIEHPRKEIDFLQYGNFCESGELGAARYRLSYENAETKKGTYSFCMCPGGYVLSSGTDADGIVVNGMSNFARNSPWSNSALVVTIKAGVDFSPDKLLAGMDYQKKIEQRAFQVSKTKASGKELPAQRVRDFLDNKVSNTLPKNSTPSDLVSAPMGEIFPASVSDNLKNALLRFDQQMKGFVSKEAVLIAPETRTSAPVTILRDKETFESLSHQGLYPCGEGAGHAGGITSAAVDGVKVVMAILKKEKNFASP